MLFHIYAFSSFFPLIFFFQNSNSTTLYSIPAVDTVVVVVISCTTLYISNIRTYLHEVNSGKRFNKLFQKKKHHWVCILVIASFKSKLITACIYIEMWSFKWKSCGIYSRWGVFLIIFFSVLFLSLVYYWIRKTIYL